MHNQKKIQFDSSHYFFSMSFLLKYYAKLQHKHQIATKGDSGKSWGRIFELLNHCHTFPKHYNCTTVISQAIKKSDAFKDFQEPAMSQAAPAKPWEGELLPGLWLCNDKDPGPSGISVYWRLQKTSWGPSGHDEPSTLLLTVSALKE